MRRIFHLFFSAIGIVSLFCQIQPGASQLDSILALVKDKNVAIITNHTAMIGNTHLVDTLIKFKVNIKKIFSPEHGFRGTADAGAKVNNEVDSKTGLALISLYGKNKKPSIKQLEDIDMVIFDIQDVGVRFYTYISTMFYAMQACAEQNKMFVVLDRPNPNGFYIDGPVLEKKYKSFLGMVPIPLVHACTVGELAHMFLGEQWLGKSLKLKLKVLKVLNYQHSDLYQLPIPPSPNLKNMTAIYLYPSLGLFEGTVMSVGRGTNQPFTMLGHPLLKKSNFSFTPESRLGAKNPKYKDTTCNGYDLSKLVENIKVKKQINLYYLMQVYDELNAKLKFFDDNFNYHAGNRALRRSIEMKQSEQSIRLSWEKEIQKYKAIRKKYLLYPDFE